MNTVSRRISELRPHPKQQAIYGDLSEAEFEALVSDIHKNGLRQPPEIASDGTIIDGHQRIRAYVRLGKEEIEVFLREGLSDDEIEERFLRGNYTRRQLDPLSKARVIQAIAELERRRPGSPGVELRDRIAQQLGDAISGRTVDRYLKLLELPLPIQEAVSRSALPMTHAIKVASLPTAKQEEIAVKLRQGGKARAVVDEYLPRPKEKGSSDSPDDLYFGLLDYLSRVLDTLVEHSDEIVGKATVHQEAAALLGRAATFCQHMRESELAAHAEAISNMRSLVGIR